jgi:hypothetical protein
MGTIIDKSSPIYGPAKVTIKPDEVLVVKSSFVSRFPEFLEALNNRDVVVFWENQFQPIDAALLTRAGGYMLFPKASTRNGKSAVNELIGLMHTRG